MNKLPLLILSLSLFANAGMNITVGTDGFYQDQGDHGEYHRHAESARDNFMHAKAKYERHPTNRNRERMEDARQEMRRYHEYH